jgi:hypothetical protein
MQRKSQILQKRARQINSNQNAIKNYHDRNKTIPIRNCSTEKIKLQQHNNKIHHKLLQLPETEQERENPIKNINKTNHSHMSVNDNFP